MDDFPPINFPKSTKTQRNKQIMRQRSAVFPHIFLRFGPTLEAPLLGCKFVCTSAAFNLKSVPGALFSAFSYLRHVKMSECGLTTSMAFPQAHQYSGNCDVSLAACYYERFI